MNSNTHNQTSDNSYLVTSSIHVYTHIIPYLPNPIYNPTIADFERLIRQNEQYFFYRLDQQRNDPSSPT